MQPAMCTATVQVGQQTALMALAVSASDRFRFEAYYIATGILDVCDTIVILGIWDHNGP